MTALNSRDNAVDWLKWIGVASMAIDHLRYLSASLDWCFLPGRIAYPAFALICGWNLVKNSKVPHLFVARVSFLGGILYLAQLSNGDTKLNPVLTLAIGLFLLNSARSQILIPAAILIIAFGNHIAYGVAGVGLVIAGGLLSQYRTTQFVILAGLLSAGLGNGIIGNIVAGLAGLGTAILLTKGITRPCPIQNSKWLYLAFPATLLPAAIAHAYHHIK